MKKMVLAVLMAIASSSQAAVIVADAVGNDTFTDADFFGVSFASGAGAIASFTFDLSPFGGDVFDFDGDASFQNAFAPVVTSSGGLLASDISSSFVGNQPTLITFNFAAGSFTAGDFFRFGADIDQLLSGVDVAGMLVSVVMEDGATGSGMLLRSGENSSSATLETSGGGGGGTVPEPATLALAGLGLLGMRFLRQGHRKA